MNQNSRASLCPFPPEARAQAPLPRTYRIPPLVQPRWRTPDLAAIFRGQAREAFSAALCNAYGVRHCLLLDSARSGLLLLARAMGLDGEWLLTSFGYRPMTLLLSQVAQGLAFAEIGADFNMDPLSSENLIGPRTQAMLVNHMFGRCADIRSLRTLADRHGLFLVENAVHASPSLHVDGRLAGSWGDASLLSFNLDKPLGALAGGALLTNRDDVWEAVSKAVVKEASGATVVERILSSFIAYQYKPLLTRLAPARMFQEEDAVAKLEALTATDYYGYEPHSMTPMQAAVALNCLLRSHEADTGRIRNAERLIESIGDRASLLLPGSNASTPNSYLYFPVVFRSVTRHDAARSFARAGIETKWRYYPLHMQQQFSGGRHEGLGNTEDLAQRYLLLPAGSCRNEAEISYLAECTVRIAER